MADSLVFRALERHVIHGRADEMAFTGLGRPMTYAHLLHDSACVAGSLRDVGVGVGTRVSVDIAARREQIIAVLACARLGAELDADADIRLTGEPPVLTTGQTEVSWSVLLHAGRMDPAPAPDADPEGYAERVVSAHRDIFAALLAGNALT
ncbi:MAG: AMP-binding protein [Aeromicrobium sp.]